jgi:hypothetical protein
VSLLPLDLQVPEVTVTRLTAGFSGADVVRVEARGRAYVLERSPADQPLEAWRPGGLGGRTARGRRPGAARVHPVAGRGLPGVRDGRERLDTPEGRWRLGLALLAESLAR